MEIGKYLDSTYLKTPQQSGLTEGETQQEIMKLVDEAVENQIFAVMIRPDYVKEVKTYLQKSNSEVKIGTVIGFHEGTYSVESKLNEAKKAIEDGADELDFVLNYTEYLNGNIELVKQEVIDCTAICLQQNKIAKWIIEIAALNNDQIAEITQNISQWITENFAGKEEMVFVKSSTGFYKTEDGKPNGATFEGIKIMLDHAGKLPVKAAGGVRTHDDAVKMISLGVKRIGTSSAVPLLGGETTNTAY